MRAYLGWKHHEAPWSEYYNSTHQTALDAKLVPDHRIAHHNVEGGGGGAGGKKQFLVKENQVKEQCNSGDANQTPLIQCLM